VTSAVHGLPYIRLRRKADMKKYGPLVMCSYRRNGLGADAFSFGEVSGYCGMWLVRRGVEFGTNWDDWVPTRPPVTRTRSLETGIMACHDAY
jgi:hypothetical protein